MNKLMIVMIALFVSLNTYAGEGFDKLYAKYSETEEVMSINLTQSMIGLASKFIGENDVDAKKLLESVKGLKLLIAETPNSKLKTDANTLIISGSYEELMKIKDGADNISIMVQESGEIIKDVIVMVDSPDEFVFINLTGNIDPQQVGKVLKTLNIKVDGLSTN
jgi:hypothetical protein